MQIEINLPHVFNPGSNPEENAYALMALLDCLIRLDQAFLMHNTVPTLYRSGVVYARTRVWDTIPAVMARRAPRAPAGYGDCKSLTAWRVAELRNSGVECDAVFRWNPRQDNPAILDFHILVQRADGVFEDPSKVLGMGQHENGPILVP